MNRALRALRAILLLFAAILAVGLGGTSALAAEESVFFTGGGVSKEAPGDSPGTYVNATFTMHLPTQAAESLQRGVSLYFTTEFELSQKRWYWKDKGVVSASYTRRLSYSLLTRKYHLGGGGLSQSFATLDEALTVLGSVRRWRVAGSSAVSGHFQDYSARIRVELDKSRLPRPLQFGTSDWDMTSDWVQLPISPTAVSP